MNTKTVYILTTNVDGVYRIYQTDAETIQGEEKTFIHTLKHGNHVPAVYPNTDIFYDITAAQAEVERRNNKRANIGDLIVFRYENWKQEEWKLTTALVVKITKRGRPTVLLTAPDDISFYENHMITISQKDCIVLKKATNP
jgi:hypothetical protein